MTTEQIKQLQTELLNLINNEKNLDVFSNELGNDYKNAFPDAHDTIIKRLKQEYYSQGYDNSTQFNVTYVCCRHLTTGDKFELAGLFISLTENKTGTQKSKRITFAKSEIDSNNTYKENLNAKIYNEWLSNIRKKHDEFIMPLINKFDKLRGEINSLCEQAIKFNTKTTTKK